MELEAGLVVVVSDEQLVDVVRRIACVDTVWAVDQPLEKLAIVPCGVENRNLL